MEIRVGTTLEALDADGASLSGGERVETNTLVWTAGVRANPLLARARPAAGRSRVACASIAFSASRAATTRGRSATALACRTRRRRTRRDPPTSQHALRQARALARNLSGSPRPYRYRMLGQVATLGRYRGIAAILGLRVRGFPGWFVTRTYHLSQLPLFSRKLRVVVDWTVALFFRRDIAELGTLGHPRRLGES